MCIATKFDDLKIRKMVKLSNGNMEREDIENCHIYLKLILWCNLSNSLRSLVCQPAPQLVLQVPHIYSTQAYNLKEKFVKTLKSTVVECKSSMTPFCA